MSLLVESLSRVELDQLARDILRYEVLAAAAAERRRWGDVAFYHQQRDLTLDRRYDLLRQYLAHLQFAHGTLRYWWRH